MASQPLLIRDEKDDVQALTCRQFQDLPPSFQMPTILKIVVRLKGFPDDLLTLRKRVKQRLAAYNYIDRYTKTVSDVKVPPHVLKTTADFCDLGREYTVPTIINLLWCLSEVDLKEICEILDKQLSSAHVKIPFECPCSVS